MTNTTQTTDASSISRLDFARTAPKAFKALLAFDGAAREHLDPTLVELVQIRASQLNNCAYCLHMRTHRRPQAGESEERLHWSPCGARRAGSSRSGSGRRSR
ncbi:hypothetical protein SRIMM317S_03756 [Streptomyces rimosus subsp. rimosus]